MRRINLSYTAKVERRILDFLVKFMPDSISPNMLTFVALLSAIIGGLLYLYIENYPKLLFIINICLVVHWLADSLDGRLARVRKIERPRYGYYIDHILDSTSATLFIGGLTTSNSTETTAWVWVLSLMLLSMIHVFLKNKVFKVFELSVQQFGPTEARLGLFFINLFIFSTGNIRFYVFHVFMSLFDLIGWIVALGFIIMLIPEIIRTGVMLDREDKGVD